MEHIMIINLCFKELNKKNYELLFRLIYSVKNLNNYILNLKHNDIIAPADEIIIHWNISKIIFKRHERKIEFPLFLLYRDNFNDFIKIYKAAPPDTMDKYRLVNNIDELNILCTELNISETDLHNDLCIKLHKPYDTDYKIINLMLKKVKLNIEEIKKLCIDKNNKYMWNIWLHNGIEYCPNCKKKLREH